MCINMASSTTNLMEIENAFAEFYYGILPVMYDLNSREFLNEVKSSLKDIRQLKRDIDKKQEKLFFADVHYKKTAVRCAYLYAYSVLHSITVHSHFSTYLEKNQDILQRVPFEKEIKICCLGGGPGTEAIAICKIFDHLKSKSDPGKQLPLNILFTVIDICSEWEKEVLSITDAASKHSNLFDSKKINIKAEFIQANLLNPFQDIVKNKIKEATVVTMVKLASAINETPYGTTEKLQIILKNVIDNMAEDSYLFLLDNAGGPLFSTLTKSVDKASVSEGKESLLHKEHRLNIKTLLKAEKLINIEGNAKSVVTIPTRMTTVSSCFWRIKGSRLEISVDKSSKKKDSSLRCKKIA